MVMLRRFGLFIAVNLLVVLSINIVLQLLGVGPYLTARGVDWQALAAFCLVWGMGGSFISLLLSKPMAKWSMGVEVIDPATRDPAARELVQTVHGLAQRAGLPGMPEVGIYDSPEINAFATGATRGSALVAVSTGLLRTMDRDARDGVLGHEVAHIANGDMVTLTLLQGVVNAFAMFAARALALVISDRMGGDDGRRPGMGQFLLIQLFQFVFTLLGSVVVAWFSRWREFRADAGGADYAGRERMIRALAVLQRTVDRAGHGQAPALAAFKISGGGGWMALLSTHPPLEDRIAALRARR